jgi:hypothetical protein
VPSVPTLEPAEPLRIASFKLQFAERRVRIVPAVDPSGCPFAGPGVDLVLDEADEALALARPLLAWLEAREPVRVRSLSLDVGRRRLLVTLEVAPATEGRPRVLKVDPGIDSSSSGSSGSSSSFDELLGLAAPLLRRLGEVAPGKLAARGQH